MSPALSCPTCGEDENLRGQQGEHGIRIACGSCGATWLRDAAPRCATCGGGEVVIRPRTMTQYSRGTQLSVVGWQDVALCVVCDAEAITRSTESRAPLPAGYRPAALYPREQPGG